MGMYCWCGERRDTLGADEETEWDKNCTCDLTGFVRCSERLPEKDGQYEVRIQSGSADIYQETATFSLIPKIKERDGYYGSETGKYHWSYPFDSWDADRIFMWRKL